MSGPARNSAAVSPIEAARARHRLADVAARTGAYVAQKHGRVTVNCPMPSHGHPDRSPSMRLYLDDDRYYCFGCGARGDVVQWAQDVQGVSVLAAVAVLDAGVTLHNAWSGAGPRLASGRGGQRWANGEEAPAMDRTPSARVLEAVAAAWAYYTRPPLHGAGARYLRTRGVDVGRLESVTGRPEVGLAHSGRARLLYALGAQGFGEEELVDAGLAKRDPTTGDMSDFYCQRVLLPVRDGHGNVAGLIGRNVGFPGRPKYKNPPRTVVYDNSADLYRPLPLPSSAGGRVVVVEGPIDALAIAANAVAAGREQEVCPLTQSGRELSAIQVRSLVACSALLVLAFDGDEAGVDSARRYARQFAAFGRNVVVAPMPAGQDPASWLTVQGEAGLSLFLSASDRHPSPGHIGRYGVPANPPEEAGGVGL